MGVYMCSPSSRSSRLSGERCCIFRCPEMHEHAPDGANTIYFSNTFSICPTFFSTLPVFFSALPSASK